MSVPPWKQAIIERRKKQEDEQKKKQAEEEAYLATLPPWKRALFLKRERERQQQEREREKSPTGDSCERSNSFLQRQQQLAEEREQRQSSAPSGRRATPPLSPNEATSPSSSPYDNAHHFFPSTSSTQPPRQASTGRRTSITTLPGVDEVKAPIAEKVATAEIPTWQNRARSSSESSGTRAQKVVSNVKKFNEVKTQSSEIPAWKKALLQRRKEKEQKSVGRQKRSKSPTDPLAPVVTLPVDRRGSPTEETDFGVSLKKDKHLDSEAVSLLAIKRKPSPEEMVAVTQESSLQLQRKRSPNESEVSLSRSPTPEQALESTQAYHSAPARPPKNTESKPPGFSRKMSPVEFTGAQSNRSESPTEARNRVSSITSTRKSGNSNTVVSTTVTIVKTEPGSRVSSNQKPAPRRAAPVAPSSTNKQSLAKQQNASRAQQPKQIPEVVNRGISEPPKQSHIIQREGVTQRAPIYKEVEEWANVSDDDPKFRSLPTWKQALIKRRRADIAKRMGLTTSVDDVPLSNGPIANNKQEGVPFEDQTGSIPPWKKQMMQRKAEGTSGQNTMSSHEKKHLLERRSSPDNSSSNVRALLGRFNERSSPSPPSPTSTVPVVTISKPRPPSPSSGPITHTETHITSGSLPAYSSSGVPQVSSSSSAHSKKSFTWTPGEDTMPADALSDDSSDEEEGEYTITNIDDTSEEEEEEDEGKDSESESKGDGSSGVVLLRPPQTLASPNANEQTDKRVRKTSSILADSNRPRRKVCFHFVYYSSVNACLSLCPCICKSCPFLGPC